jgi:hypothetical protein
VPCALLEQFDPRYSGRRLHQLLQYHVLDDSIYAAMQVLGLKDVYPPAGQQGLDMLHRLGMHNDVVEVLLEESKVGAPPSTRSQRMVVGSCDGNQKQMEWCRQCKLVLREDPRNS